MVFGQDIKLLFSSKRSLEHMQPKFLSRVELKGSVKTKQVAEQVAEIRREYATLEYATSARVFKGRVFISVNLVPFQLLFSQ